MMNRSREFAVCLGVGGHKAKRKEIVGRQIIKALKKANHTWSQLLIEYLLFHDSFLSLREDRQLTRSTIYSEIQPWFCLNQEFKQFLVPSNLKASRYIIKSDPQ